MGEQDHAWRPRRSSASAGQAAVIPEAMGSTATGWRHTLTLLGIPVVFIADDPQLLEAACAAYADWRLEAPGTAPEIVIRLVRSEGSADRVSCGITVEGSRLALEGGGISGWADAARREGWCTVPAALIDDAPALAEIVTDPLLLFLLTRAGRTPIHASGVMIGGTAAILSGPSGTGKSTLALAAARRGLPVLSDDTVYVEPGPPLRVWGFPRPIHVFAEEAPAGDHRHRLRGGKLKAAIPLPVPQLAADRAVLVLLERGSRLAAKAADPAEALAALSALEPGFDLLRADTEAALRALSAAGTLRLTLTDDPQAAIDLLSERLAGRA